MAHEGHPLNKESSTRRRNEQEYFSEAARLSLINPFDSRPLESPIFHRPGILTANVSTAGPASDSNLVGLRQRSAKQNEFLEMEEALPSDAPFIPPNRRHAEEDLLGLHNHQEPIKTSSGLFLTHRQTASSTKPSSQLNVGQHDNDDKKRHASMRINSSLETDWGSASSRDSFGQKDPTSVMISKAGRWLKIARVYIVIFALMLVFGTLSIIHSSTHEQKMAVSGTFEMSREKQSDAAPPPFDRDTFTADEPRKIILLPIQNVSQLKNMKNQLHQEPLTTISNHANHPDAPGDGVRRALTTLREEFDQWIVEHEKTYASLEEKESRFHIWSKNHHRTMQKNKRHGPCKLTKQPVFGSNLFKDLSPDEFQGRYLTGYKGPKTDDLNLPMQQMKDSTKRSQRSRTSSGSGMVLDAENRGDFRTAVERHPDVQKRLLEHLNASQMGKRYIEHWEHPNRNSSNITWYNEMGKRYIEHWDHPNRNSSNVTWYNNLNQPNYTWYADAVMKATRAIQERSYNNTLKAFYENGVCTWYDVSCWLRWCMDNYGDYTGFFNFNREPAFDSNSYPSSVDWRAVGAVTSVHSQGNCGACWAITAVETVESANFISSGILYELAETEIIACDDTCEMCNGGWPQNAYEYVMKHKGLPLETDLQYNGNFLMALTMVTDGESDSLSEEYIQSYLASTCPSGNSNGQSRYGNIKGYGYATDRCVCYSDGSGCDCDKQNEELAVANVATYGPATVCLEASLWQDYSSGIITSELGCSSAFMDMNHCVQAVGYAFLDVDESEGDGNDHEKNKKGSTRREGYWIIRNQWSSSWGMKGYAYVAMGENTCGVLNDMTIVYK